MSSTFFHDTNRSCRKLRSLLLLACCSSLLVLVTKWPSCEAFSGMDSSATANLFVDPMLHFSIGAIAGGVGAVAAYPFDYIKSQMQTEYGKTRYGNNGLDCLLDTIQQDGPMQLYKGVTVQVLGIAPEKGIKLGVNDVLASIAKQSFDGTFPLWCEIISGGIAGACQVVASSPLEVLKVGLQTSNMTLEEAWHNVGGFHGLFRGVDACIVRDVVFTAICFPLYTYWIQQGIPPFVAGALSGVIASFVTTPPDVIKTRILAQDEWTIQQKQIKEILLFKPVLEPIIAAYTASNSTSFASLMTTSQLFDKESTALLPSKTNTKSLHSWNVLQQIWIDEGPTVLFSGVNERCIGAIPRFGTTLAIHDYLENIIHHAGWFSSY